jgi:peptidoglycan/xylan/chitin deacetylase (PgdA/CDA1 family)
MKRRSRTAVGLIRLRRQLLEESDKSRTPHTVVSLTFDDGWQSDALASSILLESGIRGTFYVNSLTIGTPGHLSWAQLDQLAAAGQEIGGHTLDHPDLTRLRTSDASRAIHEDREALVAGGFAADSFAYPFGVHNETIQRIARDCGYSSARAAWGLRNLTAPKDTRPNAETVPPRNPYAIRTPGGINAASFQGSSPTATALANYVESAERDGGGWVAFVFHRVCDDCGGDDPAPSINANELRTLADWLERRAVTGTVVRTVGDVISSASVLQRRTAEESDARGLYARLLLGRRGWQSA